MQTSTTMEGVHIFNGKKWEEVTLEVHEDTRELRWAGSALPVPTDCHIHVGAFGNATDAPGKLSFYLTSASATKLGDVAPLFPFNISTDKVQHMRDIKRFVLKTASGKPLSPKKTFSPTPADRSEDISAEHEEAQPNPDEMDSDPNPSLNPNPESNGHEKPPPLDAPIQLPPPPAEPETAKELEQEDAAEPKEPVQEENNPPMIILPPPDLSGLEIPNESVLLGDDSGQEGREENGKVEGNRGDVSRSIDASTVDSLAERERRSSDFYMLPAVESGEEDEASDVLNVRVDFQGESFHVQVGKDELDQLTIGDLKSSICFKITALTNAVVRPENIVLAINDAPLRNHWTCADVCLHAKSTLTASISKASIGFAKNATTPIFSLHVEMNDRVEMIHVRNGDVPELLATAFTRMQGLDASYVPPLVAEIYRGLSKVFATEVAILQTKLRQQQDASVVDIDKGKESIIRNQEEMLDKAGEQIKDLKRENERLREELMERRFPVQSNRLEVDSPPAY